MSATDLTVRLTLAGTARYGAAHPGASGTKREDGRSVFCTRCGQQNPDDSRFCARCGAPTGRPAPHGQGESSESTSTISLSALEGALDGGPAAEVETSEEHESGVADTLPPGSALLDVK